MSSITPACLRVMPSLTRKARFQATSHSIEPLWDSGLVHAADKAVTSNRQGQEGTTRVFQIPPRWYGHYDV